MNFLKFKKKNIPTLKSLRSPVFNVDKYWFIALAVFALIIAITIFIGLNMFFSQYSENYKSTKSEDDFQKIIDIERLKNTIEKRNEFINQEFVSPRDPSM